MCVHPSTILETFWDHSIHMPTLMKKITIWQKIIFFRIRWYLWKQPVFDQYWLKSACVFAQLKIGLKLIGSDRSYSLQPKMSLTDEARRVNDPKTSGVLMNMHPIHVKLSKTGSNCTIWPQNWSCDPSEPHKMYSMTPVRPTKCTSEPHKNRFWATWCLGWEILL